MTQANIIMQNMLTFLKTILREMSRNLLVLVALGGMATVALAFTEPSVGPTGGTVYAPVNVSGVLQTKTGSFTSNGTLTGNTVNATQFLQVAGGGAYSKVVNYIIGPLGIQTTNGPVTLNGSGVTQSGNTFTFSGGGGSGTVTSVASGAGLTGGPITTSGTLSADTAYLQRRVSSTVCSGANLSIKTINADGTVTCETDDSGGGASQWVTSGSNIYYNTGNVGIGTINPDHRLVVGPAGGGRHLVINDIAGARWGLATGGFNLAFQNDNGGTWNTRMIINGAGNVGIGTISPTAQLHISGDGSARRTIRLEQTTAGTSWAINNYETSAGEGAGNFGINQIGSGARLVINTSGNVGIGTISPGFKLQVGNVGDGTQARANAWNALSDIRLKDNLVRIDGALDKVSRLNGYYFNWKEGIDTKRHIGVVAQDVENVLPEIISVDPEGYKSLDYGRLTPLLIEAVKELKIENDALKARIEALEMRQ